LELGVGAMPVMNGAPVCSWVICRSCGNDVLGLEFVSCSMRKHCGSYELLKASERAAPPAGMVKRSLGGIGIECAVRT